MSDTAKSDSDYALISIRAVFSSIPALVAAMANVSSVCINLISLFTWASVTI
tara:strand:- start:29 stop:184 length:156 start_codon:yes stop_codon:yes gene_type:complete